MSWPIKRHDLEPPFRCRLMVKDQQGNDVGVDLTGATVEFIMTDCAGAVKIETDATIMSESDKTDAGIDPTEVGWVMYEWVAGDTDTAGKFRAEWEVSVGGRPRTFPPNGYLYIEIGEDLDDDD